MNGVQITLPVSIIVAAFLLSSAWMYTNGPFVARPDENSASVLRSLGAVRLPISWDDLGEKMIAEGVIDSEKISDRQKTDLNLLWAFGLSNRNPILEKGPMMNPAYGGAENFASTGGWTISKGDAMDHYSKHSFVILTGAQQKLVERVSQNIYRPCCNNSTYFPDCNHGMAMLGLLELLASRDASEKEMYATALNMNAKWFPDQYETIESYLKSKGRSLKTADPKEILGKNYSSASGFRKISSLVPRREYNIGGAGCGIEEERPRSSGCGIE